MSTNLLRDYYQSVKLAFCSEYNYFACPQNFHYSCSEVNQSSYLSFTLQLKSMACRCIVKFAILYLNATLLTFLYGDCMICVRQEFSISALIYT